MTVNENIEEPKYIRQKDEMSDYIEGGATPDRYDNLDFYNNETKRIKKHKKVVKTLKKANKEEHERRDKLDKRLERREKRIKRREDREKRREERRLLRLRGRTVSPTVEPPTEGEDIIPEPVDKEYLQSNYIDDIVHSKKEETVFNQRRDFRSKRKSSA